MTDASPFASQLRTLRLRAGLTQERLADRAGVSARAVRALENGDRKTPRLETVRMLADGLGLDTEDTIALLRAARLNELQPRDEQAHSVPYCLTELVGREAELAMITSTVAERKLVTLTGTGGVGKTRLAVAFADQRRQDGVASVFVDLGSVPVVDGVASAVAEALSVRGDPKRDLTGLIIDKLRATQLLLILDNMEHLLDARTLVLRLIKECPRLTVLVTSREALRVRGEVVYTVAPLGLPERDADISRSPAVRLFLDRARDAGFTPLDSSMGVIADICRYLDGLPLAIELAASWMPALSPEGILERLTARRLALESGPEDLPLRQRTMSAAIGWSFELLSEDERTLFRRLSVFSGGCSLQAAETVFDQVGALELDTLTGLKSLVGKSLVTTIAGDGARPGQRSSTDIRFDMLEVVREYARSELVKTLEYDLAREQHGRYFLALCTQAGLNLNGPDRSAWLGRLKDDHANLRTALYDAREREDVEMGLRLSATMWPFWLAHHYFDEARYWLDESAARSASLDPSEGKAYVLLARADLIGVAENNEACLTMGREALEVARRAGADKCAAAALLSIGVTECGRGHYAVAEQSLVECLEISSRLDEQNILNGALSVRATVQRYQGEFSMARSLYEEALEGHRKSGDSRNVAGILARLGNMSTERGYPLESEPMYNESLSLFEDLNDTAGIADVMERKGETATSLGLYSEALNYFAESLDGYGGAGLKYGVAYVLLNQSEALLGNGAIAEAIDAAYQSLEMFREIDDRRCVAFALMHISDAERAQGNNSEALQLCRESLQIHFQLNTRPQIARCLERIVALENDRAQPQRATVLHGIAGALRETMEALMSPVELGVYRSVLQSMNMQLGKAEFDAFEDRGRAMTLADGVQLALTGDL